MDKETLETGLRIRTEVLGKEYVENSMKNADDFNRPFQEFVSEYCWGAGWGRPGLTQERAQHAQSGDDRDPQPPA